jgi:hypothetical protein
MRLVDCIIGGAVLCGSFFIALWLIEPEAPPQRLEGQRISQQHYNELPTATQNAGLARNSEQQRRYERIDEILAQRQITPKDSEAREGERAGRDTIKASHKTLAKKHHPDQIDALLGKM